MEQFSEEDMCEDPHGEQGNNTQHDGENSSGSASSPSPPPLWQRLRKFWLEGPPDGGVYNGFGNPSGNAPDFSAGDSFLEEDQPTLDD